MSWREGISAITHRQFIHTISKATVVLSSRILSVALLAMTYSVAAHHIGPSSFAPIAAIAGASTLIFVLADAGLNSAAIRSLAHNPSNMAEYLDTRDVKRLIAVSLGGIWIVACIGLTIILNIRTLPYMPFGLFVTFRIAADTILVPAVAKQRFALVSSLVTFERAVCLLTTVSLLNLNFGVAAVPSGLSIGAAAYFGGARLTNTIHPRPFSWPRASALRRLIRSSSSFWSISIASQARNLDTFIVGLVSGAHAAGLYGAAARLMGPLALAASSYAFVLFPQASAMNDPVVARRSGTRGAYLLTGLAALLMIGGWFLAPWIIDVGLGKAFSPSVGAFRLVLLGACLAMPSAPLASVLQAQGQEASVARVVLLATSLSLTAIAAGSEMEGPTGAAAGVLLGQLVVLTGLLWLWNQSHRQVIIAHDDSLLDSI